MRGSFGKRPSLLRREYKVAIVATVILLIIGGFVYAYWADSSYIPLAEDWRVHLSILDALTNQNVSIPGNIGVPGGLWFNHTWDLYGRNGYAPMGTRDTSGTIYIQSVAAHPWLLGNFFDIWGQFINNTCVGYGPGTYCSPRNGPVPWITNNNNVYCTQWGMPLDNGKSWIIVIGQQAPETPICA